MKGKIMIVALAAIMTSGIAFAGDCPKGEKCDPPPKEEERMCSIGWYKNNGHDTWYPSCVEAESVAFCDAIDADLNITGKGAGTIKNAAGDFLVANYVDVESCEEAE